MSFEEEYEAYRKQIAEKVGGVKVPIVRLSEPKIEERHIELDKTIPEIKPEVREPKVPIVELPSPPKVEPIIKEFDTSIPKMFEKNRYRSILQVSSALRELKKAEQYIKEISPEIIEAYEECYNKLNELINKLKFD